MAVRTPRTPRIPRAAAAAATLGLLAAGCAFGPPSDAQGGKPPNLPAPTTTGPPSNPADSGPPSVVATVIAQGLDVPWAVDFLPDGAALVTERNTGQIKRIGPERAADGLKVTTVATIDEAEGRGEGGLLGIAVSPEYETDETIFIYYTTARDNRIARLRLGERPEPIVTGIPAAGNHDGGRLHFGPDGYLYASTGDASDPAIAQDVQSLGGKILRMTRDGEPASGNPFPDSLVYSYGHRNVEGFAWDEQGHLYATEFGQNTWDEINAIEAGNNYGWPKVEGRAGADDAGVNDYVDPIQQWPTDEASCSGAAMTGRVLVAACLHGQRLWLVRITESGTVLGAPTAALVDEYGRLRAAAVAPDGSIWVTTSNRDGWVEPREGDDKILRIVVAGGGAISKA